MSIIVLCAGGHARVVIEALRSRGITVAALTDADERRVGVMVGGVKIIGSDQRAMEMPAAGTELVIGLGNRATRNNPGLAGRRALFDRFTALGYRFPVVTHAASVVASDAALADGAQVLAGAIVQPAASVGRNAIVNTGAIVEHDCRVGDHVHIAPGAILCGGVSIGSETHIGAGAVVLNGVTVGNGVVVAAGAVVAANVADGAFAGTGRDR
jgi:UDP-perosamine 4-acetyltransferase